MGKLEDIHHHSFNIKMSTLRNVLGEERRKEKN